MNGDAVTNQQINPLLAASQNPNANSIEQAGQYDRARLGYFSNRVLVFQILNAVTDTSVFVVPDNTVIPIRSMWVFNSGGAAVTLFFKIIPSGVTPATWLSKFELSIASKETKEWTQIDDILESNSQILAWSDVAGDLLLKVNGAYVLA